MKIKSAQTKLILFTLYWALLPNLIFSQNLNYYDEVKSNVSFPKGFDENKSKQIIATVAIEKQNLFKKGKLVTDQNWEVYLNAIAAKLLQNEPTLIRKIKVWCVKDLTANALSYIDGSIFINQGLIIHLKTESELAFIIAHEIAHVMKQHALKEIELQNKILAAEINADNYIGRNYRNLVHSKENEYEADGVALKLVIQAGYQPNIAIQALSVLHSDSSLYPRLNIAHTLGQLLNNPLTQLDSTEWIKSKKRDEKVLLNIQVSSEDQFETHPDISKRIISLREQLEIYDKVENSQLYQIKDSVQFRSIQRQLSQSVLTTAMEDFEYQTAIMLVLTNTFQFEQDVRNITLLKSLYFIAQSKENKYDEELLNKCTITVDSNLIDINKIVYSYNTDKFKKLVYGYAKKLVDQKQNEDNYFYYALCNEAYLGKQTSQIIFQNLLNKYPNGKYAIVAKQKLSQNENK